MDSKSKTLLAEFTRGGQLIRENAEQLYREACILGKHAAPCRALCLHQLSNEECGKLELLGSYAVVVACGMKVSRQEMRKTMERAFRSHEAKNHANAYFAAVVGEERAARDRKDWHAASKAFAKVKRSLHSVLNTAKNGSLYVNFEGGKFSAPSDQITEELVAYMKALNEYLLSVTAGHVRLLHRLEKNEWGFQGAAKEFVKRMVHLQTEMPPDLETGLRTAYQEMVETVKAKARGGL